MIVLVAVAPIRVMPSAMTVEERVERSNTAGGLDRDVRRRVRAHQPQVVVRGATRREAGRGLDEVGAGGLGQVAGADLLVVGQVGVLEDDLDDRAGRVGDLDDGRDVGLDVRVAAGLERADLDDHVDLGRARRASARCASKTLVSVRWLPCGKPIVVPTLTSVPSRIAAARATSAGRTHTDATSYSAARRQPSVDERVVQLRPQQRVVDRLGDVALGQVSSSASSASSPSHLM